MKHDEVELPDSSPDHESFDEFFFDLEDRIYEALSGEERVALLRNAIAEQPQDASLYGQLVYELYELNLQEELLALLHHCDRQGLRTFENVARSLLLSLSPEEIARFEQKQMDDPATVAFAARLWLYRGRAGRAVDTALRSLAMAEELGALKHPADIPVLLLRLQAQGRHGEAPRLQEHFQSFLDASGLRLDLLDRRAAELWQFAQEMSRLSPQFPAPARAAIGAEIAAGMPLHALSQLRRLILEDGDAGRRMAAELAGLPGLHRLYHYHLGIYLGALAKPPSPLPGTIFPQPWSADLDGLLMFCAWLLIVLMIKVCTSGP